MDRLVIGAATGLPVAEGTRMRPLVLTVASENLEERPSGPAGVLEGSKERVKWEVVEDSVFLVLFLGCFLMLLLLLLLLIC